MSRRSYLDWKYAPDDGADDEPPRCDVDGCGEEGLNMVGTGFGTRFVCDDHKPGKVEVGGTPGCAAGQRGEP